MDDEKIEGCTCDECYEEHTCPYKAEINDDEETMCTCCDYCRYECSMDI